MSEDSPNSSRGQGDLLGDPHREASDINLVGRAVRLGWPVSPEIKSSVVSRLKEIVEKREVAVMTKEGPATMDGPADASAVAASRVLVAMDGLNQADYHLADKNKRMDEGKATDVIAVEPVILRQPVRK